MNIEYGIYRVSTGEYIDISKLLCIKIQEYGDFVDKEYKTMGYNILLTFQLQNKPIEIWQTNIEETEKVKNEILNVWEEYKKGK